MLTWGQNFSRVCWNKFFPGPHSFVYRTTSRELFFRTLLHILAAAAGTRSDLVTVLTFAIHKKNCVVYFFGFWFALFILGHHILLGGVGWSQVEPGGAGWSQVEPGGAEWSWVQLLMSDHLILL